MYQQGDIVSVSFPFTDLSQAKLRPALIISNDTIKDSGDLILIMITSQSKADGINIPIPADHALNKIIELKKSDL
jgi:mRNA interferase MazF